MTNERWLRWAISRHFRDRGFRVDMSGVKLGNAVIDGEVVGTLQLTFIPGLSFQGAWRAQVEGVRVRGDLRNRRIGTRLMEWAIGRARDRGCRLVQLMSNQRRLDARRFYERLGFSASHVGMKLHLAKIAEEVDGT